MRSLTGFNSSAVQGSFASGQPVSASELNKLATAASGAATMMSNDLQYFAGTTGACYGLPQQTVDSPNVFPWQLKDNGDNTFSVYPSTINSLIPCIGNVGSQNLLTSRSDPTPRAPYVWNSDGECYIYIKAGPQMNGILAIWPSSDFSSPQYPIINGYNAKQNDSDNFGHILIAMAQKDKDAPSTPPPPVSFIQFISNPVWSERHKFSQPNSAFYYFYRV
jgi:hypothetical protein